MIKQQATFGSTLELSSPFSAAFTLCSLTKLQETSYKWRKHFFLNSEFSRNTLVWYGICQWANLLRSLTSFIQITNEISDINVFGPPVYMYLYFFKIHVFVLILNQQLKFAGRWKNVPILFLKTNSNFDFVLYLSHIRKCSNSGYQIISFCNAFLGALACVAWAVLKGWFTLFCWSLKFRHSSKIYSANGFWRVNDFITFDT